MTPVSLQALANARTRDAAQTLSPHQSKRLSRGRSAEKPVLEMKCGAVKDALLPPLHPHPQTR